MPRWTQREVEFLRRKKDQLSYAELARRLGRTKDSVKGKMRNEGLKKQTADGTRQEASNRRGKVKRPYAMILRN